VWRLVDSLVCWMNLGSEARLLILRESRNKDCARVWQHGRGDVLLIGR
jgi:hypothetical protein